MSNVFINRNRSQGGYGIPISNEKYLEMNDTWYSRKADDQFHKTSLKYSNNLDLAKTKVNFQWTLNDTTDAIRKAQPGDTMDNATAFKWKQFNSFERKDHKANVKQEMSNEIMTLALKLSKAREDTKNMTYSSNIQKMTGSWKVPEVESMNRTFNESTRFYNTHNYQRKHGLRYVPPPVAENVQQLVEEQKLYDLKRRFDSLAPDQQDAMVGVMAKTVMPDKKPEDIVSLLSNKDSQYQSRKQINSAQSHRRGRSLNLFKSRNGQEQDEISRQGAQRVLSIASGKMGSAFQFPKRERFNEDVDVEVKSQRTSTLNYNSTKVLNAKNLDQRYQTLGEQNSQSQKTAITSITKNSKISKANTQKTQASKKTQKIIKDAESGISSKVSRFLQRRSQTQSRATESTDSVKQRALKIKFFRQTDQGNPRYFAEKTPSTVGLLCGQRTRPQGFKDGESPSELEQMEKQQKCEETTSTLLKKTFQKEQDLNQDEQEQNNNETPLEQQDAQILSDNDNASEVSFNEENLSDDGKDPDNQAIANLFDTKNIGGGKMMSWGTGYQFGIKQGYQSPEEKQREKTAWENHKYQMRGKMPEFKLHDDRLTVATSNDKDHISVVSNASTGFYSRECQRLEAAVQECKETRLKIERQVELERQKEHDNKKMIEMQLSNDNAVKLLVTDQRNMMYSGQNYMRHPQIEDL